MSTRTRTLTALAALVIIVAAASLTVGVVPTTAGAVAAALPDALALWFGHGDAAVTATPTDAITTTITTPTVGTVTTATTPHLPLILAEIRLPRLLLALAVGAGLAVAGAVMQGLFRNPMADPGLLGVSSGAALGAVTVIVVGGVTGTVASGVTGAWLLPAASVAGGAVAMLVVHRLSVAGGATDIATMLLAGIAVNAIAGALIGLLSYLAADSGLRDLIFWSLGSLEVSDTRKLFVALAVMVPAVVVLPRFAGALNANLLGEREAGHLGVAMEKVKRRLIVLVALIVGVAVSMSGVIGFVGLVVPHLVRIVAGPDHRLLLPASALAGAALLTAADIVARAAVSPAEIPIGIITAILGGPFFLFLLLRYRRARSVG